MENTDLTPFEAAENFVHALAEGLCITYAMTGYFPAMDELEARRMEAYSQGDYQLAASIQVMLESLNQKVIQSSFEA